MPVRKGRSKLDLVKLIFEKLESAKPGEQLPISTFQPEGLDNKRSREYIELINYILKNGKEIEITEINRFTFINFKKE